MSFISRGFHGRRASRRGSGARPAGPVRDARLPGPLRRPDAAHAARPSGTSRSSARSTSRAAGRWEEFRALPSEEITRRHPLRDQVVEARHRLARRLRRHAARRASRPRPSTSIAVRGRRLHDQPAARGRHRRQGVDRVRVRRRAARARARRPGADARPAPLLLEEREVGARPAAAGDSTSRASGRSTATTTTAIRGRSSGTGATDLAARRGRRDRRRRRRASRRSPSTSPAGRGTAPGSTSTSA